VLVSAVLFVLVFYCGFLGVEASWMLVALQLVSLYVESAVERPANLLCAKTIEMAAETRLKTCSPALFGGRRDRGPCRAAAPCRGSEVRVAVAIA